MQTLKTVVVFLVVAISISVVARTLWKQDLQYALPTPIPASYKAVPQFAVLALPDSMAPHTSQEATRPMLLNFFNPDCPCSRFNLDHVRALQQRYGTRVRCITVVETQDSREGLRNFGALHLAGEFVADTQGKIAAAYGVYSTPQAVILDAENRLIYRGNYNTGRYCAEPQSEYARLALDALLSHATLPHFSDTATRAYGCALPCNMTLETSR